jgi:hypothetical protein
LFYFHQFYPEMLGALVLALAFRVLALRPQALVAHPWRLGWLLATLPWLHQKFLPGRLLVTALLVGWPVGRVGAGARMSGRCICSRRISSYHDPLQLRITGSVRPDALFLAWGPGGVTSARIGQGLVGLLLDARYGILPYVPVLLLAGAGLVTGGARRFAPVLPAALAYYLTVASADNWSGAVCNLGRYFMPVAPLAVALVGMAIARTSSRRGAVALVLVLVSWTALIALVLRQDPPRPTTRRCCSRRNTYAGRPAVRCFFAGWMRRPRQRGSRHVADANARGGGGARARRRADARAINSRVEKPTGVARRDRPGSRDDTLPRRRRGRARGRSRGRSGRGRAVVRAPAPPRSP